MLVGPQTRVLCMSNAVKNSTGCTVCGDLRNPRAWFSTRGAGASQTIAGQGTTIFLLDYFFLPSIYYKSGENIGDGYGGRWFSHLLPLFFQHGGHIAILPNDKWGLLEQMRRLRLCDGSSESVMLTTEDAGLYHPLFMATQVVTSALGSLIGVADTHQSERNNGTQIDQYLDPQHPFCLVYSTSKITNEVEAKCKLQSLVTKQSTN